jgi:hypothetical protein
MMSGFGVTRSLACCLALGLVAACSDRPGSAPTRTSHEDLVQLFREWREFQKPKVVNGVPDYSTRAMAAQQRELAGYQQRLSAFDTSGGRSRSRWICASCRPR